MHFHLHLRKRLNRGLEPYPARKFWLRTLDKVVLAVGIIGPIMAIPQIALIYGSHNASGVSALAWGAWTVLDLPWILYGVVHRDRAIVVTYTLWFIFNLIVCIGAVLYGN